MSKLNALLGKAKVFKIGEVELEIKPLTVHDLELFNIDQNMPLEQQVASTKKLISKVLKDSVPDATEEEINNIAIEHLEPLMNAIMEVNKLSTDRTQRVKDVIKARQTQAQATKQG